MVTVMCTESSKDDRYIARPLIWSCWWICQKW